MSVTFASVSSCTHNTTLRPLCSTLINSSPFYPSTNRVRTAYALPPNVSSTQTPPPTIQHLSARRELVPSTHSFLPSTTAQNPSTPNPFHTTHCIPHRQEIDSLKKVLLEDDDNLALTNQQLKLTSDDAARLKTQKTRRNKDFFRTHPRRLAYKTSIVLRVRKSAMREQCICEGSSGELKGRVRDAPQAHGGGDEPDGLRLGNGQRGLACPNCPVAQLRARGRLKSRNYVLIKQRKGREMRTNGKKWDECEGEGRMGNAKVKWGTWSVEQRIEKDRKAKQQESEKQTGWMVGRICPFSRSPDFEARGLRNGGKMEWIREGIRQERRDGSGIAVKSMSMQNAGRLRKESSRKREGYKGIECGKGDVMRLAINGVDVQRPHPRASRHIEMRAANGERTKRNRENGTAKRNRKTRPKTREIEHEMRKRACANGTMGTTRKRGHREPATAHPFPLAQTDESSFRARGVAARWEVEM
ncbi:hypothetical protein PLEOSDRAFT_164086 [Pleurotus ostreatus PC15]|uniref:Uncharacterized protein n=1 Tax=Pleurotus ostreatus (strain PC15) TaxID=1137138 RepID=A0A067P0W5_PLEO1|nr:hypothetical protein PLEOSDRAFT_164086 [Pleurotus ostreatus PC15]